MLGLSKSTLRSWRKAGTGPPWFRAGRRCLYRLDWLLDWMEEAAQRSLGPKKKVVL